MCAGASVLARVARVVYGADDPKAGRGRVAVGRRPRPPAQPSARGDGRGAGRGVRRRSYARSSALSGACSLSGGGVSERPKEHASKACEGNPLRGFKSHRHRQHETAAFTGQDVAAGGRRRFGLAMFDPAPGRRRCRCRTAGRRRRPRDARVRLTWQVRLGGSSEKLERSCRWRAPASRQVAHARFADPRRVAGAAGRRRGPARRTTRELRSIARTLPGSARLVGGRPPRHRGLTAGPSATPSRRPPHRGGGGCGASDSYGRPFGTPKRRRRTFCEVSVGRSRLGRQLTRRSTHPPSSAGSQARFGARLCMQHDRRAGLSRPGCRRP